MVRQLKACGQETALAICEDIHIKYKEMHKQLEFTQLDLSNYRKKRLQLEKLQNKVTREKQGRIRDRTRKLRQASYDLKLVQSWTATYSTRANLNNYIFQNPVSWMLGDKPLYNTRDRRAVLPNGVFAKGSEVYVRSVGDSEYRVGKIDSVCQDGTYDVLYDDGYMEPKVTRKRIRPARESVQDEDSYLWCTSAGYCKGCGIQCQTGECETCCGTCRVCGCAGDTAGCCGTELSAEVMAQNHKHIGAGNYSMRERAAIDPYAFHEQMMGNYVGAPSLEHVLYTFYHNMHRQGNKGNPPVQESGVKEEVQLKWDAVERGKSVRDLNEELMKQFGCDLNSVFEPVFEPMNRAGFMGNFLGSFHGKVKAHHTHLNIAEKLA